MKILDRLPILSRTTTIQFGTRHVPFHRHSIVVWISIGRHGDDEPARISQPFPAMLDSGNNNECFLNEHHLNHWAELPAAAFDSLEAIRINGQYVPRFAMDIWIHPNVPGAIARNASRTPFRLKLDNGVAIGPPRNDRTVVPRVPLVGFSRASGN